jgi:hypothetical protein
MTKQSEPDKEMRIVLAICVAIVLVAALITFWAVVTLEKPRNHVPKPARIVREYMSEVRL